MEPPRSQGKADGTSKKRDQTAFNQQLLKQPSAGSSKRKAHADFASPRCRPRKQKTGHICARNQQEERHGAHRGDDDGPCIRIHVSKLSLAHHTNTRVALNLRKGSSQLTRQNIELHLRVGEGIGAQRTGTIGRVPR